MNSAQLNATKRSVSFFDWDSPVGFIIDILFGVIPAVLCVFLCFLMPFGFGFDLFVIGASIFGFTSCATLIYVTSERAKTKCKKLVYGLLIVGIVLSCYLALFFLALGGVYSNFIFLPVIISLAALKHMISLARATPEVHP